MRGARRIAHCVDSSQAAQGVVYPMCAGLGFDGVRRIVLRLTQGPGKIGMSARAGSGVRPSGPDPRALSTNRGEQVARKPVTVDKAPGRNDPCPCGSGKKYKKCHGRG